MSCTVLLRGLGRGPWFLVKSVQNVQFVHGHWTGVQSVQSVLPVPLYSDTVRYLRSTTRYNARLCNRTVCTVCTYVTNLAPVPAPARRRVIKGFLYKMYKPP